MTADEIDKKWGNRPVTPDEWATMSDEEAAYLLRRDILGNYAYRGYHRDTDKFLEQCRKAVHAARNFTFSKPKYKVVTRYKHGLTMKANDAFYVTWDLKIVTQDSSFNCEDEWDMKGTFCCFPEWKVSPIEYRRAIQYIGQDHVAKMTIERQRLWDEMKAAVPSVLAKHLKGGKVEDKTVEKASKMIEILEPSGDLDLRVLQYIFLQAQRNNGIYIGEFLESCRRNSATLGQLNPETIKKAWELSCVKKVTSA